MLVLPGLASLGGLLAALVRPPYWIASGHRGCAVLGVQQVGTINRPN